MPDKVDLYHTSYGNNEHEAYRAVRRETYGEDFGQTSWVTNREFEELPRMLNLVKTSRVLEIGSGAGGCAVHFAEKIGCHVTGMDINAGGIRSANELIRAKNLTSRVRFVQGDAAERLPFDDNAFDAVYSNDAMCHVPGRLAILQELHRVLNSSGRLAFSDALVVDGVLSNEEIATRSSIGFFVFLPRGENEKLIERAGFQFLSSKNTNEQASEIAKKWHDARVRHKTELIAIEGEANFAGLQRFLNCVRTVTGGNRLSRYLYLACKPSKKAA